MKIKLSQVKSSNLHKTITDEILNSAFGFYFIFRIDSVDARNDEKKVEFGKSILYLKFIVSILSFFAINVPNKKR
jgi:hypothetical protein